MFMHLLREVTAATDINDAENFHANNTSNRIHQLTVEGPSGTTVTIKAVVEVTNYRKGGWIVESAEKTLIKPQGATIITEAWPLATGPWAFIRARITSVVGAGGKGTVTMGGQ